MDLDKYFDECLGLPGFYSEEKETNMTILDNYLQSLSERNDAAIAIAGAAGDIGEKIQNMYMDCSKKKCGGGIALKKSKRMCKLECKVAATQWGLTKVKATKGLCGKAKTPRDKELCLKEYNANVRALESGLIKAKKKLKGG